MTAKRRAGTKQNKKRGDHLTPLMWACVDGDLAEVDRLIASGADVNEATRQSTDEHQLAGVAFQIIDADRTALMIAAGDARLEIMTALIDGGARLDAASAQGTPLSFAADAASVEAVDLLLSRGSDVNQRAPFTPLYTAAAAGAGEVVELLLARGAEVDAPIWTEATALMGARTARIAELLLARGADPDLRDRRGRTALHATLERGTRLFRRDGDEDPVRVVDILLANGADPSVADEEGITPLHIAAELEDRFEIGARLLAAGAAPDAKAANGMTPLLRACEIDQLDAAVALLDAGANIEARDASGASPWLMAARNGYVDLGYELLARGAARDDAARQLATENRRDDFVRMLDGAVVAAKKYPKHVIEACQRAEQLFKAGEYAKALALYGEVPERYRERIFACVSNMGYCLQQTGKHAESGERFERALVLDPTASHLWRGLCFTYYELKRWDDMERAANQATTLTPTDSWSWQQLAIARGEKQDHRGAVDAGERAVELEPNNAYALFNLASQQKKLGRGDYRKTYARALRLAAELAVHLDPDDKQAFAKKPKPKKAKPAPKAKAAARKKRR